ncbi:hypothetical protein [Sagittula salina]|uniref:Lipoprotein n=1 Tax=Sagittula salina TaxID=2820268 RepID=A0A940S347_9RHOB|nr:hypothetical protein [Sagittula salina]MBP0482360.1 hypothetical protein [Sagittula salina]
MRLVPLLALFLVLAACDMAGPGFSGAPKVMREVEGTRFTLRRRGDVVEAIRTSSEVLPRFPEVARKAGIAAQKETGCRALWIMGDPAMMWVGLACAGRSAPGMPKRPHTLFCEVYDAGHGAIDLECSRR